MSDDSVICRQNVPLAMYEKQNGSHENVSADRQRKRQFAAIIAISSR